MNELNISDEVSYKALINKDSGFVGLFFAGIKTTGIFCIPTCRARKPKKENVEFFRTAKEAMVNGYRPCKVCKPLENPGETTEEIKSLFRELELNPTVRITDYSLTQRGIEPNKIRRWFLKNHGMTFQTYQRMLRINYALQNIIKGDKVIEAAYESGYESLSGFQHSFKKVVAQKPSESRNGNILSFERFSTPLGTMMAIGNDEGIYLLEFTDRRMLETELKRLEKHFKASILPGSNKYIQELKVQLKEYFEGKRKQFDVPLRFFGTAFQKNAWNALLAIPYGKTRSYKEQAQIIHRPKAVRAVGTANGCNRIAIVIPCHRVIGENGKLTGYGGGLWRKKWLLEHEKKFSGFQS
ncbi:MAG TPA: methylated-DNA--[protein]-cysteine S-methyltransferase [Ignavibacteriaceae bacterium]|nr:methylated-DNA--[protein]-cysteine S-methyltransferase [Ignavibacteriaceae bacterium]